MSDREIETLADALAYLKPDPANNGTISLRAPKARQAVEVIEASIAEHRAQDREDGAREMRERAHAVAWTAANSLADKHKAESEDSMGQRQAYALWLMAGVIAALPCPPHGRRTAMRETSSNGDVIVCPSGPNRGIWCRTQQAFDAIAAVAKPMPQVKRLPTMPAPGSYDGTIVAVASAEKWRELEAAVALAEQEKGHG